MAVDRSTAARPPKIVVVGLGRMGRNHLRVVRESPDFALAAVVVGSAAHPEPKDLNGAPFLRSVSDLAGIDFDCAIVATPTATHHQVAMALLAMDKHLLVEKPIADTFERGKDLIEIARARGLHLAVGHVERFNPAVRKLREVIREGWLGTPIHFSFTRVGGYPETVIGNNNVLLDLAVHDIDVLRSLAGPVRFEASRSHSTVHTDIYDTAEIFLSTGGGASAALHVNWVTPTKIRTIRVTGTRGVVFVDFILQTCEMMGGRLLQPVQQDHFGFERLREMYQASDRIDFGIHKEEPLKAQLRQFAQLLATGDSGELCLGKDALSALLIAERSIEAERRRSPADSIVPTAVDLPAADALWV